MRDAAIIPLVDLKSSDAVLTIRQACEQTGFFYLVNHAVPRALIDAQYAATARLFDLPAEGKAVLSSRFSTAGNGYDPMNSQILQKGAASDLKESYHCGPELDADHPYVQRGLPRYGHNLWPSNLPGFRAQCLAYFTTMQGLGEQIMDGIALSLDLPQRWFRPYYNLPMSDLRLLHYPSVDGPALPDQFGAGAHTDWGAVTILAQDDVGGLEVMTADGDWIDAPPIPGSFVINIGQLIARWTNGRYRSNLHRVRTNRTGRSRYSIPFFYNPDFDARIECLDICLGEGGTPRWAPCTAGEHIDQMRRASMARVTLPPDAAPVPAL